MNCQSGKMCLQIVNILHEIKYIWEMLTYHFIIMHNIGVEYSLFKRYRYGNVVRKTTSTLAPKKKQPLLYFSTCWVASGTMVYVA